MTRPSQKSPASNLLITKKNFHPMRLWLPAGIISVYLLLSFSFPENSNSSDLQFVSQNSNLPTAIDFGFNDQDLETTIQEATIYQMEQTAGFFSKILNLSVADESGNVVALILTDVQNAASNECLTHGFYFGKEHSNVHRNFSMDLGTAIFSSSCNLILENENGESTGSRNGWIKITSCADGLLTGAFEFKLEENSSGRVSKGAFENIAFRIEK